MKSDGFCIVGGGLVGLATALQRLRVFPNSPVTVLEKEGSLAAHQSTHNSGVLHAGLSYRAGSVKAALAVRGMTLMTEFCQSHDIPYDICGKVVIATSPAEILRLRQLEEQGRHNGLAGLRRLPSPTAIRELEPHAGGLEGLHVPAEGIVDYAAVARAMASEIERKGGMIVKRARVTRLVRDSSGWQAISSAGDFRAGFVVVCGGLQSDRLVRDSGMQPEAKIVPFRGEYYELTPGRQHLVRNLIYPVPDPKFPFLGVHFTRMIRGGVEAGPNAVLALDREGYQRGSFRLRDAIDAVAYPGLWRFVVRHGRMAAYEWYRSWSRAEFCRSLQRLVPEVQPDDLIPGTAGVRAQAMRSDGRFVDDFHFVRGDRILHVVNAPSPAATASLAIGERIVAEALQAEQAG
jgi:L-2-hydroxyglutarate oxidase